LSGFIKAFAPADKVVEIIKLIDKVEKISTSEFDEAIKGFISVQDDITKFRTFLDAEKRGDNFEVLHWLKTLNFNEEYNCGVNELTSVLQILKKLGIEDRTVKVSTKLARGLTYYTGTVFETVCDDDLGDIGSISGGGRYDNLATMLSDKAFPGVGGTIGISRLIPKLMEKGLLKTDRLSPASVLVTVQNREFIGSYMKISNKLRKIGVKTETYLQDKSLGAQLSYASRKGYDFAIIANEVELLESRAILRNLKTKEQKTIRTEYMEKEIPELLKSAINKYAIPFHER
jgi:histidyl-tRNA synthetase